MRPAVHTRPDGIERVWRSEILPLLEELHYGDGVDVAAEYGVAALRRRIATSDSPPGPG